MDAETQCPSAGSLHRADAPDGAVTEGSRPGACVAVAAPPEPDSALPRATSLTTGRFSAVWVSITPCRLSAHRLRWNPGCLSGHQGSDGTDPWPSGSLHTTCLASGLDPAESHCCGWPSTAGTTQADGPEAPQAALAALPAESLTESGCRPSHSRRRSVVPASAALGNTYKRWRSSMLTGSPRFRPCAWRRPAPGLLRSRYRTDSIARRTALCRSDPRARYNGHGLALFDVLSSPCPPTETTGRRTPMRLAPRALLVARGTCAALPAAGSVPAHLQPISPGDSAA